jgi:hypothetical protein
MHILWLLPHFLKTYPNNPKIDIDIDIDNLRDLKKNFKK